MEINDYKKILDQDDVSFDEIRNYNIAIQAELKKQYRFDQATSIKIAEYFRDPEKNYFFRQLKSENSIAKTHKDVIQSDFILNPKIFMTLRRANQIIKQLGGKEQAIEITKLFVIIKTPLEDMIDVNKKLHKENKKLKESYQARLIMTRALRSNIKDLQKEYEKEHRKYILLLVGFFIVVIVTTLSTAIPFYIELFRA